MSATLEMYINRAAQCRREAAQTRLENVRERCLRAADKWDAMAQQLRTTEIYRANEVARKAEQASPPIGGARGPGKRFVQETTEPGRASAANRAGSKSINEVQPAKPRLPIKVIECGPGRMGGGAES